MTHRLDVRLMVRTTSLLAVKLLIYCFMRSFVSLIILLAWAMPIFAQQPSNSLDWNAVRTLVGRFTFHDGPNCYNSTMIAKGYSSIVSQTSDEGLKYYLWNFCRRINKRPKPGDILVKTVQAEREVEHSAVYLGNGKIFEKASLAGLNGRFSQIPPGTFQGDVKAESRYSVIKTFESSYFNKEQDSHRVYRCMKLETIKAQTGAFERSPEFQIIQAAKQTLSNLAFDPAPGRPENYQDLPTKIEAVAAMLDQLAGSSEEDLFLYANAASVWINFANIAEEFRYGYSNPRVMGKEFDQLSKSFSALADRIRAARKGPEISFIVGDPWKHELTKEELERLRSKVSPQTP